MKNSKVNSQELLNILLDSNFDYEYSGSTPNSEKMQQFTSAIEDALTIDIIEKALEQNSDSVAELLSEYNEQINNNLSLHGHIAIIIADTVGQIITNCNSKYNESVTFTIS